jgi:hypothetical protein
VAKKFGLAIPGKQIVLDAMVGGLLINCTHDTVLRFRKS